MSQSRHPRHYVIAIEIISTYNGNVPLPIFLAQTFKQHKQWGSKDRKAYRDLIYLYFKHYRLFVALSTSEKIEQLKLIDSRSVTDAFHPFAHLQPLVSKSISFPNLKNWFIPIPPFFFLSWETNSQVLMMERGGVPIGTRSYEFTAGTDLTELIEQGKGIIQDISSTEIIEKFAEEIRGTRLWDCCSGAGGKALTIQKIASTKELFCSDIRESILENLIIRFKQNQLSLPNYKVVDLEHSTQFPWGSNIDIIFADVPCSGSGTWRRNPEGLAFFDEDSLKLFTSRQQTILRNLVACNPQKGIIYATCSLFEEENEGMIQWFLNTFPQYICKEWQYHGNIDSQQKGDILFSAWLRPKD